MCHLAWASYWFKFLLVGLTVHDFIRLDHGRIGIRSPNPCLPIPLTPKAPLTKLWKIRNIVLIYFDLRGYDEEGFGKRGLFLMVKCLLIKFVVQVKQCCTFFKETWLDLAKSSFSKIFLWFHGYLLLLKSISSLNQNQLETSYWLPILHTRNYHLQKNTI